ncbi:hypothetical protein ACHHYP_00236 [Achlya hypogyna]|uniref:Transmembrane protein n=1 Tax=Achlya hypogyna TaxID=1202772 RepID=A0A1V9ZB82_ACHHY|nr:hypothetical protein ACHHYP_00236 [Achlya hypogyna]
MGIRRYRRTLQVVTILGIVGGVVVAYYGITLSALVHASVPDGSFLSVAAVALSTLGCLYACASILGFCGSTAKHERVRCLMVYFYATIIVCVVLVLFAYLALAAPSTVSNWLRLHWSSLGLEDEVCCSTFDDAHAYLRRRFISMGIIAAVSVVCMLLALYCVIKIVTVPVVMRDILTVINVIFIVLGLGMFSYGIHMTSHDVLDAGQHWIASLFIGVGVLVFTLSTIGLVGAKAKNRSVLLVYAVGIGLSMLLLVASAVFAFIAASHLAQAYGDVHAAGDIACSAHLFGCSNCTGDIACLGAQQRAPHVDVWQACNTSNPLPCHQNRTVLFPHGPANATASSAIYNQAADCGRCPEWPPAEVSSYVRRCLDLVGIVSLLNVLFLAIALGATLILRRSLLGYQTESI